MAGGCPPPPSPRTLVKVPSNGSPQGDSQLKNQPQLSLSGRVILSSIPGLLPGYVGEGVQKRATRLRGAVGRAGLTGCYVSVFQLSSQVGLVEKGLEWVRESVNHTCRRAHKSFSQLTRSLLSPSSLRAVLTSTLSITTRSGRTPLEPRASLVLPTGRGEENRG